MEYLKFVMKLSNNFNKSSGTLFFASLFYTTFNLLKIQVLCKSLDPPIISLYLVQKLGNGWNHITRYMEIQHKGKN